MNGKATIQKLPVEVIGQRENGQLMDMKFGTLWTWCWREMPFKLNINTMTTINFIWEEWMMTITPDSLKIKITWNVILTTGTSSSISGGKLITIQVQQ